MPRRPRAGQVSEASLASHDDATPAVQEEDAPDAEPAETHSDLVPLTYDELLEARQLAALLAPTWQQMRERDAQLVCRWPLEYRGIIRPTKKSKISEQAEYASRTRDTPRPGISVAALPSAEEAAAQGRRGNMQYTDGRTYAARARAEAAERAATISAGAAGTAGTAGAGPSSTGAAPADAAVAERSCNAAGPAGTAGPGPSSAGAAATDAVNANAAEPEEDGSSRPAGFGGPVPMDWHLQAADGNSSESDSEADDAVDWRCIAFVPPPLDAAPEEAAIRHTCGSWNPPERRRCCACRAPRWEDELHSRVAAILQTSDLSTVTVRQVMQRLQHEGLRPNGRGLLFPKVAVRHAVERFVRRSVKRERHEGLQEVLRFGTFPFAFSGDLDHTGRMHGHLDEDELDRDIMTSFEELSRDDDDVPLPSVDPQKAVRQLQDALISLAQDRESWQDLAAQRGEPDANLDLQPHSPQRAQQAEGQAAEHQNDDEGRHPGGSQADAAPTESQQAEQVQRAQDRMQSGAQRAEQAQQDQDRMQSGGQQAEQAQQDQDRMQSGAQAGPSGHQPGRSWAEKGTAADVASKFTLDLLGRVLELRQDQLRARPGLRSMLISLNHAQREEPGVCSGRVKPRFDMPDLSGALSSALAPPTQQPPSGTTYAAAAKPASTADPGGGRAACGPAHHGVINSARATANPVAIPTASATELGKGSACQQQAVGNAKWAAEAVKVTPRAAFRGVPNDTIGLLMASRGQLYSEEVGARQGRKAAPKSKGSLAYLLGSRWDRNPPDQWPSTHTPADAVQQFAAGANNLTTRRPPGVPRQPVIIKQGSEKGGTAGAAGAAGDTAGAAADRAGSQSQAASADRPQSSRTRRTQSQAAAASTAAAPHASAIDAGQQGRPGQAGSAGAGASADAGRQGEAKQGRAGTAATGPSQPLSQCERPGGGQQAGVATATATSGCQNLPPRSGPLFGSGPIVDIGGGAGRHAFQRVVTHSAVRAEGAVRPSSTGSGAAAPASAGAEPAAGAAEHARASAQHADDSLVSGKVSLGSWQGQDVGGYVGQVIQGQKPGLSLSSSCRQPKAVIDHSAAWLGSRQLEGLSEDTKLVFQSAIQLGLRPEVATRAAQRLRSLLAGPEAVAAGRATRSAGNAADAAWEPGRAAHSEHGGPEDSNGGDEDPE